MFETLPLEDKNLEIEFKTYLQEKGEQEKGELKLVETFCKASKHDAEKALFQLPLPTLDKRFFERRSPRVYHVQDHEGEYAINDKWYSLKLQWFQEAINFSIPLTSTNRLTEQAFEEKFTKGFVQKYLASYQEWTNLHVNYRCQINYSSYGYGYSSSKYAFDEALLWCLCEVISPPFKYNMKLKAEPLLTELVSMKLLKDMKILKEENTSSDSNKSKDSSDEPTLCPALRENGTTLYLGLTNFEGMIAGYCHQYEKFILITALGGTQFPSLRLGMSCNILGEFALSELLPLEIQDIENLKSSVEEGFKLNFDELGFARTNLKEIKEVQEAVRKVITIGCLLGVNKVMLTTYADTLLIEIDHNFEILGTSLLDNDTKKEGIELIKASYYLVKSNDPLTRLKIAAFLDVNESSLEEMKIFQERVTSYLQDQQKSMLLATSRKQSRNKWATFIPRKRNLRRKKGEGKHDAKEALPANGSGRLLVLDGDVLDASLKMDLSRVTKRYLQSGPLLSQVLVVDSQLFLSSIPPQNIFCRPLETEKEILIKVFDPLWAFVRGGLGKSAIGLYPDVFSAYELSVDSCVREIEAYKKLEPLSGTVIPKIYGYGTIDDCTISVGKPYIRCWGPAVFIENLELFKDTTFKKSDVDRDFLKNHVEPAVKQLHKRGVVHGDLKFRNIIVSKDRDVKIIDFGNADLEPTPWAMKCEIDSLYDGTFLE